MWFRRPTRGIVFQTQSYLFCLDNLLALGLFTSSVVALIIHKIIVILLHGPLPFFGLIFLGPFLFVFDLVTLVLLRQGLGSAQRGWQILAGLIGTLIISCSATFVSFYLEANAEVNWGRSVEVFPLSSVVLTSRFFQIGKSILNSWHKVLAILAR
jgi:hypothetical protein